MHFNVLGLDHKFFHHIQDYFRVCLFVTGTSDHVVHNDQDGVVTVWVDSGGKQVEPLERRA